MVNRFNQAEDDGIVYVSTKKWIPEEPLHPDREGHKVIAEYLTAVIEKLLKQ